jgi:type VI protein secretion system component Hcp
MPHRYTAWLTSVVIGLLIVAAPTHGQFQAVMKVDGMLGESQIDGYAQWSDILSYNISVQNGGWNPSGDPVPASLSDMYVTKYVDSASPLLFGAVLTGQRFNDPRAIDAQIHLLRSVNESFVPVVKWLFNDVVVSSYNTVYDGPAPAELVALDYGEVTYQYYPLNPDGTLGPVVSFTYNRSLGSLAWLGDTLGEFRLIAQYASEGVPEPTALVLAGIGWVVLGAWGEARRRTMPLHHHTRATERR